MYNTAVFGVKSNELRVNMGLEKKKGNSANKSPDKPRRKETDPVTINDFGFTLPCKYCWSDWKHLLGSEEEDSFAVQCKNCKTMGWSADYPEAAIWIWNQEMGELMTH